MNSQIVCALKPQRRRYEFRIDQKVQSVGGSGNENVCVHLRIDCTALSVFDGHSQATCLFYRFEQEAIVSAISEGHNLS